MTISLEMVLPGLAGYWLDLRLDTKVVFMLVGFAVGMFVAMKHLLHSINKAAINKAAIKKAAIKKSESKNRTERKTRTAINRTDEPNGSDHASDASPPSSPQ